MPIHTVHVSDVQEEHRTNRSTRVPFPVWTIRMVRRASDGYTPTWETTDPWLASFAQRSIGQFPVTIRSMDSKHGLKALAITPAVEEGAA